MLAAAMDLEIAYAALQVVDDIVNTVHGKYEPATFKQATTCSDSAQWWQSMEAEMAAMKRLGVFTYVPRHLVPVGVKIIRLSVGVQSKT